MDERTLSRPSENTKWLSEKAGTGRESAPEPLTRDTYLPKDLGRNMSLACLVCVSHALRLPERGGEGDVRSDHQDRFSLSAESSEGTLVSRAASMYEAGPYPGKMRDVTRGTP